MIIHIDMDAFYAAVEIRDNPQLQGKAVVVGGLPTGRGVVSTANYEARRYGVHSAMPAAQAIRLCPHATFVRPRMEHYVAISRKIREIFFRFTPLVEPISLDEAFLDVTGSYDLFGSAESIAKEIKQLIMDELSLTASAGVAANKFIAKVASDLDKPDGLVIVEEGREQEFLDPLPIRRVWGIGPKTEQVFSSLGVSTVAGIRGLPLELLRRRFGVNCEHFWRLSRGLDSRPVVTEREARSISHETTFSSDINDPDSLLAWAQELAGQVGYRMRRLNVKGKTVQVKLRYSDFRTITRRTTLPGYTSTTKEIDEAARSMLRQVLGESHQPARLIGIGVANLNYDAAVQRTLFDQEEHQKQANIERTCDTLKEKFGRMAIRPASALQHNVRMRRNPNREDRH